MEHVFARWLGVRVRFFVGISEICEGDRAGDAKKAQFENRRAPASFSGADACIIWADKEARARTDAEKPDGFAAIVGEEFRDHRSGRRMVSAAADAGYDCRKQGQ